MQNYVSSSDLALNIRVPLGIIDSNKTGYTTIGDLVQFVGSGGGASYTPVYTGGKIIYDVPLSAAGGQIAAIPSLAGRDFTLDKEGYPLKPGVDFDILAAGGFKLLKAGDLLIQNQRFQLDVFSLQGTSTPTNTGGGTFITGVVEVVANKAIDPLNEIGKLFQVRANTSAITIALPDITDVDDNSIVPIETIISNTKPCTINTSASQLIYMNDTSYSSLRLHPGEVIWLFRGEDGWYVINDFGRTYDGIGEINSKYKVGRNELLCKGQLVNRADYPRLWEYAQTLGGSIVTEELWNTATATTTSGKTVKSPYKGCFSVGDGSTNFRLPDLMNAFLRGVKSETGTDAERLLNKPGAYQDDLVGSHAHTIPSRDFSNAPGTSGPDLTGNNGGATDSRTVGELDPIVYLETRPRNAGVLWTIKY